MAHHVKCKVCPPYWYDLSELLSALQKGVRRDWPELPQIMGYILEAARVDADAKAPRRTPVFSLFCNRVAVILVEDVSHAERGTVAAAAELLEEATALAKARDWDGIRDNVVPRLAPLLLNAKKARPASWARAVVTTKLRPDEPGAELLGDAESRPPEVDARCLSGDPDAIVAHWTAHEDCTVCSPLFRLFGRAKLRSRPKGGDAMAFRENHCAVQASLFWHAHPDSLRFEPAPPKALDREPYSLADRRLPDVVFDKHTRRGRGTLADFRREGARIEDLDPLFDSPWYRAAKALYERRGAEETGGTPAAEKRKGVVAAADDDAALSPSPPSRKREGASPPPPGGLGKRASRANHSNDDQVLFSTPLPTFEIPGDPDGERLTIARHVSTKQAVFHYRGAIYKALGSAPLSTRHALELDALKTEFGLVPLDLTVELLPFRVVHEGRCGRCPSKGATCSLWTAANVRVVAEPTEHLRMTLHRPPPGLDFPCEDRRHVGLCLKDYRTFHTTSEGPEDAPSLLGDWSAIMLYHFLFNATDVNQMNMVVTTRPESPLTRRLAAIDGGRIDGHRGEWYTLNTYKDMTVARDAGVYEDAKRRTFDTATRLVKSGKAAEVLSVETLAVFCRQLGRLYGPPEDPTSLDAKRAEGR